MNPDAELDHLQDRCHLLEAENDRLRGFDAILRMYRRDMARAAGIAATIGILLGAGAVFVWVVRV